MGEKDKEGKEGNKVYYPASYEGGLSPAGETLRVHREHTPQSYSPRGVKEQRYLHTNFHLSWVEGFPIQWQSGIQCLEATLRQSQAGTGD